MGLQHMLKAAVALLMAAVLLVLGWVPPVGATPQQPARPALRSALPAASVATKLVLPETSIDGPALSSVVGSFEGRPFNKSAIAWTGSDAAHHLNVETSADGLHFANKRTPGETSPFRPDVPQIGEP